MSRECFNCRLGSMLVAGSVLLLAGCGEPTNSQATGPLRVTLQKSAAPGTQATPAVVSLRGIAATAAAIDPSNVLCLDVEITGVHLLPVVPENEDPEMQEENDAAWVRLSFDAPITLDLVGLPGAGEEPVEIVFDPNVPAGDYRKLRLITGDDNAIYFHESFEVGQTPYAGNDTEDCVTSHPVNVPSGSQTGLKTDIVVMVGDPVDGTQSVGVLFDEDTTVRNASATGTGTVNLNPVLRTRP